MPDAEHALARLEEGNRRFCAGEHRHTLSLTLPDGRPSQIPQQAPFAAILGCADSRVPVEMLFDQGLGDLFVVRVAGNVVAPSQIASVEFAAVQFGTPLVVVLGHSECGAVQATLAELARPESERNEALRAIVDRIRPAVLPLVQADPQAPDLLSRCVRANIRSSVDHVAHGSRVLEGLMAQGRLNVVGAEYSLETGVVTFLD